MLQCFFVQTTNRDLCLSSEQKCARKDEVDSRELDQRKTLQTQNVVKSPDENDEFEKQRTAAIAEVAKTKEVCQCFTVTLRFHINY